MRALRALREWKRRLGKPAPPTACPRRETCYWTNCDCDGLDTYY